MRRITKYFSGAEHIPQDAYIGPIKNADFDARWPGVKGIKYDGYYKLYAHQYKGQDWPITRIIEYSRTPSRHKCDARCLMAKGRNCECQCGGANHGRGHE